MPNRPRVALPADVLAESVAGRLLGPGFAWVGGRRAGHDFREIAGSTRIEVRSGTVSRHRFDVGGAAVDAVGITLPGGVARLQRRLVDEVLVAVLGAVDPAPGVVGLGADGSRIELALDLGPVEAFRVPRDVAAGLFTRPLTPAGTPHKSLESLWAPAEALARYRLDPAG